MRNTSQRSDASAATEPRRVALAGVGRLGSVEGGEGGGHVAPPAEREPQVVRRHGDQHPQVQLGGEPLGLAQVVEGRLEVALVGAAAFLG